MRIVLAYIIRSQPPTTFGSVYLLVEGNPKKFSIHSFQSDLRLLRGINVNFLLVPKLQLVWFSLFERKHKMDICTSLVCLVHVYDHLHMFTCRQLHYAHILFHPLHKVSNAGMILPIAMKNSPTTVMCFHLIPLGLLSQFKCLKIGSILTSPIQNWANSVKFWWIEYSHTPFTKLDAIFGERN